MEQKELYIMVSATTGGRGCVELSLLRSFHRPVSDGNNFQEYKDAIEEEILEEIRRQLDSWVDDLGRESAVAQNLKLPITTAEKLKKAAPGYDSPDKFNDYLYLILKVTSPGHKDANSRTKDTNSKTGDSSRSGNTSSKGGDSTKNGNTEAIVEPIGFIRVGNRSLFLVKSGSLVKVDPCFCALDFYCRTRRNGFGHFLFKQVLQLHGLKAEKLAFDRPTASMISFLTKHFQLGEPLEQPNHFVIFKRFFDP